jgi:hypothetical protein
VRSVKCDTEACLAIDVDVTLLSSGKNAVQRM